MKKIFRTRWRVVSDNCLGFEVQHRWWWFPIWLQTSGKFPGINSHGALDEALRFIKDRQAGKVVWTESDE
jgi:hypothetical protein